MGQTVDIFLDEMEEPSRSLAILLHEVILSIDPELSATIKFQIPFYMHNKWVCYLNPLKKHEVELCFLQLKKEEDPFGLLQSRGRKMVRGLSLDAKDQPYEEMVPWEAISFYVKKSIELLR